MFSFVIDYCTGSINAEVFSLVYKFVVILSVKVPSLLKKLTII